MKGFILIEVIIVLAIIAFIAGIPFLLEAECNAKTEGMGFDNRWSFLGGCQVEHKAGVWIPLERYRVIGD